MCTMTFRVSKRESLISLLFRVSNEENVEVFSHSQQFITIRTLWFVLFLFYHSKFI